MVTDRVHRLPGFEGLRLFAAASVVFSHSFLIATGAENSEPLAKLLGPGNIAGLYGVYTFFIISGFLLARSLENNGSAVEFAANRILRIYPGFIFCVAITGLLFGPIGSSLRWSEYFLDPSVIGYLRSASSCMCDPSYLPGAYAYRGSDNLHWIVNGSLWSLHYEILSYILLLCAWLIFRSGQMVTFALVLLAIASSTAPLVYKLIPAVSYTLPYFAGGVLMYAVNQKFGLNGYIAALSVVLLIASASLGLQQNAYAVCGSYIIAFLGTRPNIGSALAAKTGDISYGIYLFGWPVLQLVKQYTQTSNPWLLMSVSAVLVIAWAAISCHLIERPALRLRRPIASWARSTFGVFNPLCRRAMYLGATSAFLFVAAAILMSKTHWWFVTESIVELFVWSGIGAALGFIYVAARGLWVPQIANLPHDSH